MALPSGSSLRTRSWLGTGSWLHSGLRTGAAALCALVVGGGCVTPERRCAEYQQSLSTFHAEIEARELLRVRGIRSETPAVRMSEEAALLSKRLKTLCELLWAERISYPAYQREVRAAYSDYRETRVHFEVEIEID